MKPFEAIKISILGCLLLGIFSTPMLTATQLVGVLGTNSSHAPLRITPLSDSSTFTIVQGSSFNISFQGPRLHPFASITNPTDSKRSVTIQVTDHSKVPAQTLLTSSDKPLPIADISRYNSSVTVPVEPHQTVPLALDASSSNPDHGTIIMSISED